MLHDAESYLYQKLLVADIFPGMFLITDISVTKCATTVKKNTFSDLHYHTHELVYMTEGNSQL